MDHPGLFPRVCRAILLGCFVIAADPVAAQSQQPDAPAPHEHPGQDSPPSDEAPHTEHSQMMTGLLGIPKARAGSGTSWLPDVTPMYAIHREFGGWSAMLHENLFVQYIDESTARGDNQLGSVNWFMGMAERQAHGGHLGLRTMFSVERLTVGKCGYPDLLATGEFCNGQPLHDRQHPHDFFMEAAGTYEHELTDGVAMQLYAALAGEPALGPVAFPHRISALSTPIAPLTHHWLDATHISYGVVSAGAFGTRWKAEASAFNGREPDENRFDFDLDALDSFAARLSLAPADHWSLQISSGHLNEAEAPASGGPRGDVDRTTASATYHRLVGSAGFLAVTGAWGRNAEEDRATNAVLLETNLGLDARNTLFGRLEAAQKTGEHLVIPALGDEAVGVSKLHVGYTRRLTAGTFESHVGAALSFSGIPNRAERAYGRGSGIGVLLFLSARPSVMPGVPGSAASAVGSRTASPAAASPAAADPHVGHVIPAAPQAPAATPQALTVADAHAGHAITTVENPAVRLADLMCQPQVDPDTAPRATYMGKAYYFCTAGDRDLFLKAPAKYLQP